MYKTLLTSLMYFLSIFSSFQLIIGVILPSDDEDVFFPWFLMTIIPVIFMMFFGKSYFSKNDLPFKIPEKLLYHIYGFSPGFLFFSLTISSINIYKLIYLGVNIDVISRIHNDYEINSMAVDGMLGVVSVVLLKWKGKTLTKPFSSYKKENPKFFRFLDVIFKILIALKFLKVLLDMIGINSENLDQETSINDFNIDTDGDGVADSFGVDMDGDGITDEIHIDTDGDGIVDNIQIDTDGDGLFDKEIVDVDGDGKFGSFEDEIREDFEKKNTDKL